MAEAKNKREGGGGDGEGEKSARGKEERALHPPIPLPFSLNPDGYYAG